jgi:hypothetical protein
VKTAHGFKGRYFSLQAITATSSAVTLQARHTSYVQTSRFRYLLMDETEDDPPDDPPIVAVCENSFQKGSAPCHCNCYFRRKAWLLLTLSRLFRRTLCRCRKTKTGLAPPFFQLKTKIYQLKTK